LVPNDPADRNTTRLGQCLQPRSDIDPIAEDVVIFSNHVAKIDTDAEPDPPVLRHLRLSIHHRALDLHSAADGVHDTGKFRQQAVARVLYGAAPMVLDLWLN